jgi:hypothetical protein
VENGLGVASFHNTAAELDRWAEESRKAVLETAISLRPLAETVKPEIRCPRKDVKAVELGHYDEEGNKAITSYESFE